MRKSVDLLNHMLSVNSDQRLKDAFDAASLETEMDVKLLAALNNGFMTLQMALDAVSQNDKNSVRTFAERQIALIDKRYDMIKRDIEAKTRLITLIMQHLKGLASTDDLALAISTMDRDALEG